MPVLVLKLALTPLLIGGATHAARRWGPSIGGLIIALPLTSGPVLLFLAVDHELAFAASAALGSLAGLAAIAAFCAAWSRVAQRSGPAACLAAATAMLVVAGVLLQPVVGGSVWVLLAVVLVAVAAATRLVPSSGADHPLVPHPRWDIPARTVVATGLVVGITAVAPLLGPHWSGLVATIPVLKDMGEIVGNILFHCLLIA